MLLLPLEVEEVATSHGISVAFKSWKKNEKMNSFLEPL